MNSKNPLFDETDKINSWIILAYASGGSILIRNFQINEFLSLHVLGILTLMTFVVMFATAGTRVHYQTMDNMDAPKNHFPMLTFVSCILLFMSLPGSGEPIGNHELLNAFLIFCEVFFSFMSARMAFFERNPHARVRP